MTATFREVLKSFLPARSSVPWNERVRAGMGALIGIALTGFVSAHAVDGIPSFAWLIAPMGASAVLLFAVPSSPLAQPWSIAGGNTVAALIGVSCSLLIDSRLLAASLAIGLAIGATFVLRCIHPPGGAVALTAVLGGPAVHAAGYGFVLAPVALNSALLLAAAVLYNNATGRRYPQPQQLEARHPHGTRDDTPLARAGFSRADLQRAIAEYDQVLDVSADDLEQLLRRTEALAYRRVLGDATCADIMSRDVVAVDYGTELEDAWQLMRRHDVQALPVIDRARRVIGIATRADFLLHADQGRHDRWFQRLQHFLTRTAHSHSDKHEVVGQIMSSPVRTVAHDAPVVSLVPLMAEDGFHHVPVIDAERRLAGMVTQTDLVAALYESNLARMMQADHA